MDYSVKVKSLKKAMDILKCFASKQPLGVTEICRQLGYSKSTVHDILSTFAALDYLEPIEGGRFQLGTEFVRISRAAKTSNGFQMTISKRIRNLAAAVGEYVYYTVPVDGRVFYMDIASPFSNTISSTMDYASNSLEPMNCTGSGKAMLSFMPESFVEEYLKSELTACTEYSITDPEKLKEELKSIRSKGFARDRMEFAVGICCVAVPIVDSNGKVHGALSVSGPSERVNDSVEEKYSSLLHDIVNEITILL